MPIRIVLVKMYLKCFEMVDVFDIITILILSFSMVQVTVHILCSMYVPARIVESVAGLLGLFPPIFLTTSVFFHTLSDKN